LLFVLSLTFAASTVYAVEDEVTAATDISSLIKVCEGCHGSSGVSTEPDIPSLAGKSIKHIQEAMDQFYFYERHCPTTTYRHGEHDARPPMNMCSIASSLSDEEILELGEYFSSQPVP